MKRKSKKKSVKKVQDNKLEDSVMVDEMPKQVQEAQKEDKHGGLKLVAVLVLLLIAAYLAFYFMGSGFKPGTELTQEEFKDIFLSAETVYIVMDVRGVNDNIISNGILQCGVDFAASNGMGGKNVTPLSMSEAGCQTATELKPIDDCIKMLEDGITLYVKGGPEQTKYYSNGMVVSVGGNYTFGTCGIKVVG